VINYASYHFGERTCLHLGADIFLSITFSTTNFTATWRTFADTAIPVKTVAVGV
jgi:hypothetical protein